MLQIKIIIFAASLLLTQTIFAAYYISNSIIEDNSDAFTKCPITCSQNMTNWTGRWFTTQDPFSVCECFHGWPYCPEIILPTPVPPCVAPRSSSIYIR